MNTVNKLFSDLADWVFVPLAAWPLTTLLGLSAIVGILMTVVFKFASNQSALANVLDRSRGNALAIKLFKDDLPGMFSSLTNVILLMLLRIWYSMVPVLIMIIPLFFILAQFFLRYEFRPLGLSEQAVVELQIKEEQWEHCRDAVIEPSPQISIETNALRDEESHSIFWRIRVNEPGLANVRWILGERTVEKQVVAAEDDRNIHRVNQRFSQNSWLDRGWYTGEPAFDSMSPVSAAIVYYPKKETPIFGFRIPWWATFFVVSILVALLAQPFLKVRF